MQVKQKQHSTTNSRQVYVCTCVCNCCTLIIIFYRRHPRVSRDTSMCVLRSTTSSCLKLHQAQSFMWELDGSPDPFILPKTESWHHAERFHCFPMMLHCHMSCHQRDKCNLGDSSAVRCGNNCPAAQGRKITLNSVCMGPPTATNRQWRIFWVGLGSTASVQL